MSSRVMPFFAVFFVLALSSCASFHKPYSGKETVSPGDTKVVGGIEYVYMANPKYGSDPGEPEGSWVRKDEYLSGPFEEMKAKAAAQKRERDRLKKRLARLEAQVQGLPVPDETPAQKAGAAGPAAARPTAGPGESWEAYGSNANGIAFYLDRAGITYPKPGMTEIWRRRVFPERSFQKEIVSHDEVDCAHHRYRSVEVRGLFWDGRSETSTTPSPWIRFYDESKEDRMFADVCKGGGAGKGR